MTIQEKIKEILNKESFKVTMSNGGGEFVGLTKEEQANQILQALIEALPKQEKDSEHSIWGQGFNEALSLVKKSYEEENKRK